MADDFNFDGLITAWCVYFFFKHTIYVHTKIHTNLKSNFCIYTLLNQNVHENIKKILYCCQIPFNITTKRQYIYIHSKLIRNIEKPPCGGEKAYCSCDIFTETKNNGAEQRKKKQTTNQLPSLTRQDGFPYKSGLYHLTFSEAF